MRTVSLRGAKRRGNPYIKSCGDLQFQVARSYSGSLFKKLRATQTSRLPHRFAPRSDGVRFRHRVPRDDGV